MRPSGSGLLDIDRPHSGARSDGSTGDGRSRLDVDPADHDGRADHDGATCHNPRLDDHQGRCAWRPAVQRAGRYWRSGRGLAGTYRSTSVAGDPIEVTGTIAAPAGDAPGLRPVLSVAHGTTTVDTTEIA